MVDGPSTYAYVRNHPVGLTDRYGLASDDECCARSQELGQNGNAQGWVICCEGRKVACSFAVKIPTKADGIRRKCTKEHEKSHLPEIQCTSCTKDPVRPDRSGPGAMDYNLSECTAGRRGLTAIAEASASAARMSSAGRRFKIQLPVLRVTTEIAGVAYDFRTRLCTCDCSALFGTCCVSFSMWPAQGSAR
jgi:hypothetical protein